MKTHYENILKCISAILMLVFCGCAKDESEKLDLEGDVWITSFALDGYPGTIDIASRTVTVALPADYDVSAMEITDLEVSTGAEASLHKGDVIDFTLPRMIRVTNGDVYLDYSIDLRHDEAYIIDFKLDGYIGTVSQETKKIVVRVPSSADVTSMVPYITVSDGAVVTPASGTAMDFSSPVTFTVRYNSAESAYVVEVVISDAASAMYVGLAPSIDRLGYEEKEAATWMLNNIPNSQYVSFAEINAGKVDFSECKVIWWHFHVDGGIDSENLFDAAAQDAVTATAKMKELYNSGMNFLLTRYATYYAVKLGATADDKVPNNSWGQSEETGEITANPWSFFIDGHEGHPLYSDLVMLPGEPASVYTCDTGYRITNSTAQWHIGTDWGDYMTTAIWRTNHGASDLGYGGDGAVVVWEYEPEGSEGRILCIGSGCYDWYAYGVDISGDRYHVNVSKMTRNAIDYLSGE